MIRILLIEDDESQRLALEEYLSGLDGGRGFRVHAASDGRAAYRILEVEEIDLVISDLMLPDTTAIDIVREIRKTNEALPFLILTGQPTYETAVEAIKAGAGDYLLKPVDLVLLKARVERFAETIRLKRENRNLRARISENFDAGNIVGKSKALRDVLDKAHHIASTDVTVLLEGDSGTGKELIANFIHENSQRASRPFIKVNCGALTKSILESELFGVIRGAYTGADRDRPGFFESAGGGTIFLDEIGEMDLESQIRLLRVIEEREVVRIGSSTPVKVDVRILAATNRALKTEVAENRFREDLYYRLAVIRLHLPSLRERREDIPLLFNHYLVKLNDAYGKSVTGLSPELSRFIQNYDWPGNIRQFRNVLEGMIVLARDDVLGMEDLPEELKNPLPRSVGRQLLDSITPGVPMTDYEKAIIATNLAHTGGNREKTAQLLGISERTLYRKIKEYDL